MQTETIAMAKRHTYDEAEMFINGVKVGDATNIRIESVVPDEETQKAREVEAELKRFFEQPRTSTEWLQNLVDQECRNEIANSGAPFFIKQHPLYVDGQLDKTAARQLNKMVKQVCEQLAKEIPRIEAASVELLPAKKQFTIHFRMVSYEQWPDDADVEAMRKHVPFAYMSDLDV